jgi:hypothetical protein
LRVNDLQLERCVARRKKAYRKEEATLSANETATCRMVRKLGIADKGVPPNHGWRYTFKQIAARNGIEEAMRDYITGHAPATIGRSYIAPSVEDMANALKRFPRYQIR